MKAIRFGNEKEFHLLAFRLVYKKRAGGNARGIRRLHTKCGVRPGANDRIELLTNLTPDDLCNTCWIRATPRQKRKLKK